MHQCRALLGQLLYNSVVIFAYGTEADHPRLLKSPCAYRVVLCECGCEWIREIPGDWPRPRVTRVKTTLSCSLPSLAVQPRQLRRLATPSRGQLHAQQSTTTCLQSTTTCLVKHSNIHAKRSYTHTTATCIVGMISYIHSYSRMKTKLHKQQGRATHLQSQMQQCFANKLVHSTAAQRQRKHCSLQRRHLSGD